MDTCSPPQNTGRCHYSGNDRLCIGFCRRKIQLIPALICCLFAGLMQVAANFINDLFDFLKGTDREDRLGPERACAQGWISAAAMKQGIFITVGPACLIGCTLLFYAGWELILIGALCVLFAFLYTTGPYPLSYKGWGDVLVIVFFGFVPVGVLITYRLSIGHQTSRLHHWYAD